MDFTNLQDILDSVPEMIAPPPPTLPGLTLHVDGDYLVYYASGNDDTTQQDSRLNALRLIRKAQKASGAENVVVHNTSSGCNKGERYVIATVKPYQGQRDPGRKPKNYQHLREWVLGYEDDVFASKTWATREADDGMAACALHAIKSKPGYAAIFTRDKDLRMLPGLHVEWLTLDTVMVPPGAYDVTWKPSRWEEGKEKVYGLKWFWLQMLMGDTADYIPGLEGYKTVGPKNNVMFKQMGEKTAEKFLEGCKTSDEACKVVKHLYREFYDAKGNNWSDRFVEQAALLWMRTDNKAQVADFAHHRGPSQINGAFCADVWAAVERLEDRVREARSEADALTG